MQCSECGAALTSPAGVILTVCPFCNTDNAEKTISKANKGEAALRHEFQKRGAALYKNKRVLGALINDFFAQDPKLHKILRLAVSNNVAGKIADIIPEDIANQKKKLQAVASHFAADYDMSIDRAAAAVKVLVFCAGFADELLTGFLQTTKGTNAAGSAPLPKKAEIYQFGGYHWRVLDIKEGKALLVSIKVLEYQAYHAVETDITWAECSLRHYLNNTMLKKFTKEDNARIIPSTIYNIDNPWFRTSGGKTTTDKVFLLSIDEVIKYLGGDKVLSTRMNEDINKWNKTSVYYREWLNQKGYLGLPFYIDSSGNSKRVAWLNPFSWWLRSPGNSAQSAAVVCGNGSVDVAGSPACSVLTILGVRPALWVSI